MIRNVVVQGATTRARVRVLGALAALAAFLTLGAPGCAGLIPQQEWRTYTALHGVTFRAPSNLRWNPTWRDGGAFVAPGYYLAFDWDSYDAPQNAQLRSEWIRGKRETEYGQGYLAPWPFAAGLHVKWVRPTLSSREAPAEAELAQQETARRATKPVGATDRDYRILYVTARCKTQQDVEVVTRIFETVRFTPW
jgi:hypothetical protein